MKTRLLATLLLVTLTGCATNQPYNPVASATGQTFLLNESAFAQVKTGMTQAQVHQIMGDALVIGYSYQKELTSEAQALKETKSDYKPVTIANPYKTQEIKTKDGTIVIEFYVSSVKQSDGVVSDNELVPLIFQAGVLTDRGWDRVNALRSANPS